jgi:hypothetical protein
MDLPDVLLFFHNCESGENGREFCDPALHHSLLDSDVLDREILNDIVGIGRVSEGVGRGFRQDPRCRLENDVGGKWVGGIEEIAFV